MIYVWAPERDVYHERESPPPFFWHRGPACLVNCGIAIGPEWEWAEQLPLGRRLCKRCQRRERVSG